MDTQRIGVQQIQISRDEMEAYLNLPAVGMGDSYTMEEVKSALKAAGVNYGILEDVVEQMVRQRLYEREFLVARGVPAVDGVDGEYQFNFNAEFNNKPEVRVDGSVDYWSIHAVEIVEEGQVIAIYTEPTQGQNGVSVRGRVLPAKRGRPQPPLTGRGFERSEDNKVYTATITGKIEKQGNRIQISSVYEVFGNVDVHTGNIEFRGDVIVHGNVVAGAVVRATGSITIDGTAEACRIDAGKDVILRGGMLGAHKGVISCRGNIFAKFIEYATVEAEGFIDANSALCCDIICYDRVSMNGKQANIIGGKVYGVKGVEAASIGNQNEVKTEIQTGISKELMAEYVRIENQLSTGNEMIGKINAALKQIDDYAKQTNVDMRNDERRVALMRTRIMKQAEIAKGKEEQERLKAIFDGARGATVRVINEVHPGVRVSINTSTANLKDFQKSVQFEEQAGNVVMVSLKGELVV